MVERKREKPYTWEEVFSFDRLKRTMVSRVLESVETMVEGNEPITPEQISQVISNEWDEVKQAVRSSPAARESFRKYLEKTVSEQVANLIEQDRSELESLGVIERGL
jgi:acyl-CoA reductase-like NAD-dependent aldehyde dehydrogenase